MPCDRKSGSQVPRGTDSDLICANMVSPGPNRNAPSRSPVRPERRRDEGPVNSHDANSADWTARRDCLGRPVPGVRRKRLHHGRRSASRRRYRSCVTLPELKKCGLHRLRPAAWRRSKMRRLGASLRARSGVAGCAHDKTFLNAPKKNIRDEPFAWASNRRTVPPLPSAAGPRMRFADARYGRRPYHRTHKYAASRGGFRRKKLATVSAPQPARTRA